MKVRKFWYVMALLSVDLCPAILNDELLKIFRLELNVKTIDEFLATDSIRLWEVAKLTDNSVTLETIRKLRQNIFNKFSIFATNLGIELSAGNIKERRAFATGLEVLVCGLFIIDRLEIVHPRYKH
jgi:hypothetical protein